MCVSIFVKLLVIIPICQFSIRKLCNKRNKFNSERKRETKTKFDRHKQTNATKFNKDNKNLTDKQNLKQKLTSRDKTIECASLW